MNDKKESNHWKSEGKHEFCANCSHFNWASDRVCPIIEAATNLTAYCKSFNNRTGS